MSNIRDWCISRQLWWGHRIPVYYCGSCGEMMVSRGTPGECSRCRGTALERDQDVLDTWFSSWLWPFSTLGWPEETEDLRYYYPTSVLVTAADIIFFWVARMIMDGMEFTGKIPFRDVYLHGIVRDGEGHRMSKSRGNSPDPLAEIDAVGADALRLTMIYQAAEGEGLRYCTESLQLGRNFDNKLWNAGRFVIMNLPEETEPALPAREEWDLSDRWIISRLGEVSGEVADRLERFRLGEACRLLYQFVWHDFCDWYLELAKLRLRSGGDPRRAEVVRGVLTASLRGVLRLLHPFVPFVTEAIWQELPATEGALVVDRWPVRSDFPPDPQATEEIELFRETVVALRNLRAELGISPGDLAVAVFRPPDAAARGVLEGSKEGLAALARLKQLSFVGGSEEPPRPAVSALARGVEVFLVLDDLVDAARTRERLSRELDRLTGLLAAAERKLGNESFRRRAPREVVEKEEAKRDNFARSREKVSRLLHELG